MKTRWRRPAKRPDALHAEMRFVPLRRRVFNVISGIHACDYEIADCPSADQVAPRQIGAIFREGRIRVVHIPTGQEIRPHATHMVNPRLAPRHYRALYEFAYARQRKLRRFDWGPLASSPVLPELRYCDLVLSPRAWNPSQDQIRDAAAVASWRQHWNVPHLLLVGSDDNRLLLDLSRRADVLELTRLARNAKPRLHVEASPHPDHTSWLRSPLGTHAAECVVSLEHQRAVGGAVEAACLTAAPAKVPQFAPGSPWLYFQLPCSSAVEERLLLELVEPLTTACRDICDRWFYVRYLQPDRHIRLRLRAIGDSATEVFARATAQIHEAVRQSLCTGLRLDTFAPEYERYGGAILYDSAERVFEADSLWSLKLLQASAGWQPDRRLTLLVRMSDSLMDTIHLSFEARCRVANLHGKRTIAGGQLYRELKSGLESVLTSRFEQHDVEMLLGKRREAMAAILEGSQFASYLSAHHETLSDLLHMQANRFLGVDRARERAHFEILARTYEALRNRGLFPPFQFNAVERT